MTTSQSVRRLPGKRARFNRRRLKALRLTIGAVVAAMLLTSASIAPTEAFWNDSEATGAELRAGVVPAPQNVNCRITPPWFDLRPSVGNLVISWGPPKAGPDTLDVEGYRFYFYAGAGSPEPFAPSTGTTPRHSFTDFEDYLRDAGVRWFGFVREVVEYEIHLVTVGPGNWESDPRVITVKVKAGLITGEATCTVAGAPAQKERGLNFDEAPDENDLEELPLKEAETSEEESEGDDSTPVPSPAPTRVPAPPEDTHQGKPEVDGPAATPSPNLSDQHPSPGEQAFLTPEELPTEEPASTSNDQQDSEKPSGDASHPQRGDVRDPQDTAASKDP